MTTGYTSNPAPSLAEARALHQAGRFSDAERVYLELLRDMPENPQILYLAGVVALQLDEPDKARSRLERASEIAPQDPSIWMARGQTEEMSNNWRNALEHYDRVLQLAPGQATACLRRAFVLEMDGQVESASMGYRRALEIAFAGESIQNYSPYRNIYHCCTQKTASQWLRRIFSDQAFYRVTGLLMQPYVQLGLNEARLQDAWPAGTVITHLYVNHDVFREMPKPGEFRTFFMLRDPRDCLVSWYHSARYSHNPVYPIAWLREQLSSRSESDGLIFMIDWLNEVGFFAAQRSWVEAERESPDLRIFRYEALNQDPRGFVEDLFKHLEAPMTAAARDELCERHSWKNLAGGREKGEQDVRSHYRKAKVGDWKDFFTVTALAHFNKVTGDLISVLDYEA
jgi:Tfp pilus assembly protein PilF